MEAGLIRTAGALLLAPWLLAAAAPARDARFDAMVATVKTQMLGDPEAAIRSADAALRYADSKASAEQQATARWLLGEAYSRIEQPMRAAPLLAEARRLVESAAPNSRLHADILLSEGGVFTATGDIARALSDLRNAHRLFLRQGDRRSQAKALIMIALVHEFGNDHRGALRYFNEANEAHRTDPGLQIAIHNGRANALRELNRLDEASAAYGKALELARQMRGPVLIARVLANIARVQLQQKDFRAARATIAEGLAITRASGGASHRPAFLALGAELALYEGRMADAGRLVAARFDGVDLDATLLPDRHAHDIAFQVYEKLGRSDLALGHLAALRRLDDQATQTARSTSAALAAARFDFANQELRIAQLKADDLQKSVAFERARAHTQKMVFIGVAGATLLIISLLAIGLFTIRRSRNALAVTNVALGKALAAKTEFLATTSHEIRTPLNGILGMTQVMLADPALDPPTRDRLGVVHAAGTTMRALVDDILDVAKIETGKMTIERQPIDAAATITDAARMWQEQARAKGLAFTLALDDAPGWILGDAARLRQIVFNLLSNAVKFTPQGSVLVTASEQGERWRLTVADTGIGISPDKHEEIFESFRQADAGTTRQYGGTGLGLSICRSLARGMGGDVTVESSAGAGARFTLELPLERAASPASPGGQGMVILDRNPISRAMLKALLEPHGGPVRFAGTLEEAQAAVKSALPATILIDDVTLRAAGDPATGIAALARAAPAADIALLGPPLEPGERSMVEEAGASRIIAKPIGKEQLVAALFSSANGTSALVNKAA